MNRPTVHERAASVPLRSVAERLRRRLPALTGAALLLALLPPWLVTFTVPTEHSVRVLNSFFATFALIACGVITASGVPMLRFARRPLILGATSYYGMLAVLIAYCCYMKERLDYSFASESLVDSVLTAWHVAGGAAFAGICAVVLAFVAATHHALTAISASEPLPPRLSILVASVLLALTAVEIQMRPAYEFLIEDGTAVDAMRRAVTPVIPDFSAVVPHPDGPVVMLQLESVNALAANGVITGRPLPYMRRLADHGVYFPYFVGASANTIRSQEAILCGISLNGGPEFAARLDRLDKPCLPELLARAGYRTVYLADFPNPEFRHTGAFMKRIGFQDIHFADFMEKSDEHTEWGYTAPRYYERAFAYLRRHYPHPERLFVYIAVCAEHYPWPEHGAGPTGIHATGDLRQGFLHALAAQDRGLPTFMEQYQTYVPEAHVMVFGDHSMPMNIQHTGFVNDRGAMSENFLTTFMYVPPRSRSGEFRVGTAVAEFHGQSEIVPTVLELLGGPRSPVSLVPLMRTESGASRTAPCAPFTQPFEGAAVSVVRNGHHYLYRFADGQATYFDLSHDLVERRPARSLGSMSWSEFYRRWGCTANR